MKNYLFDFDGTLANSEEAAQLATKAAFQKVGLVAPTTAQINYYMGIPIEVSFKKMAENHHFTESEFEALLNVFRQYYREFESEHITSFDGMQSTLAQLVAEGKQLFVVSSKRSDSLMRNLHTLGIAEYFQDILGSDMVTAFKPAPDGVLAILEKWQLNPEESIMIGDAIFDLQMGKAAQVHTCGVTWGAHDVASLQAENPDYLIQVTTDLL
ncbi:HAD family hydrolase [Convivina praedatoris]|uniref:Phosphoglycolate phosphatase n=1 Tax=Convivina praedatoris TaxID=2880963 RepID=A0ABM9D1I7_9LACO|nr:HAD-IA family hydrolase [Convivina sp. LMG 32447]CAH1851681.1 Phosphoglycolate phosphatase [Convivina sp. LMG 32447]CAH1853743.1 Phosphoglycolate phosphatase [Convivina sp. LMG 32447]